MRPNVSILFSRNVWKEGNIWSVPTTVWLTLKHCKCFVLQIVNIDLPPNVVYQPLVCPLSLRVASKSGEVLIFFVIRVRIGPWSGVGLDEYPNIRVSSSTFETAYLQTN